MGPGPRPIDRVVTAFLHAMSSQMCIRDSNNGYFGGFHFAAIPPGGTVGICRKVLLNLQEFWRRCLFQSTAHGLLRMFSSIRNISARQSGSPLCLSLIHIWAIPTTMAARPKRKITSASRLRKNRFRFIGFLSAPFGPLPGAGQSPAPGIPKKGGISWGWVP